MCINDITSKTFTGECKYMLSKLLKLADIDYKNFQAKLIPNISPDTIIGIRVPVLRKFAQTIDDKSKKDFLKILPHTYYDENMLHAIMLSKIKEYDTCITLLDNFLPYIDNWAVCDCLSPQAFRKQDVSLFEKIKIWSQSKNTYTCRFGIKMLMSHFLDKNFLPEYLKIVANIRSNEYYVNMMIAWFFATALAKQWTDTFPYIKDKKLNDWIHNKTIQKAIESCRINDEQKSILKSLKK